MSQSKLRKYLEAFSIWNMRASFMWVKFGFQEDTLKIELVYLDFAIAILREQTHEDVRRTKMGKNFFLGTAAELWLERIWPPAHTLWTLQLLSGPSLGRCSLRESEQKFSPVFQPGLQWRPLSHSRETLEDWTLHGKAVDDPLALLQL